MAPLCKLSERTNFRLRPFLRNVNLVGLDLELEALQQLDVRERFRLAADAWARHGLGSPASIHLFYVVKAFLYLLCFWLCQHSNSGRWGIKKFVNDMNFRCDAFNRFVVYNLLFEVLGNGCASGPLTGRIIPPSTAWWHFLTPGTIKLPLRANPRDSRFPLLSFLSTRRNMVDVLLFVGYLGALIHALVARRVTPSVLRPIVASLGLLAVVDHTVFLASRGEVYGYMVLCHAAGAPVMGPQLVQLAIYAWAAASKFGPWFAHVIQAMLSNSPVFPQRLRSLLYRDLESSDFRPSMMANTLAHVGTCMEVAIPALLPLGGRFSRFGMFLSLNLHAFIFCNFAAGAPQEWNIFTPIAVAHLFLDASDGISVSSLRHLPRKHPSLTAFLMAALVGVQTLGSIYPPSNSFLTSMKYYAGNWPSTTWLIKRTALHKFDKLKTLAEPFPTQAAHVFGDKMLELSPLRVFGFRAMHLPYRGLPSLIDLALQGRCFDDYQMVDGELMAGFALGYNFGDGYLHGRFMLQAVHEVCEFELGDVLLIAIDSCPALADRVPWEVRDATSLWDDASALAIGSTSLRELQETQPY